MSNTVLTDLRVRKLQPDASKRVEIWDAKLPGFGVRVSPQGTKSFVEKPETIFQGKEIRTNGFFIEVVEPSENEKKNLGIPK